jgi:hypothetical protein
MAKRKQVGTRDPLDLNARRTLGRKYKASIQDAPWDHDDAHRINRLSGVLEIPGWAPRCKTCGEALEPRGEQDWTHIDEGGSWQTTNNHALFSNGFSPIHEYVPGKAFDHEAEVDISHIPGGMHRALGPQFNQG